MLNHKIDSFLSRCGSGYKILAVIIFSSFLSFISSYIGVSLGIFAIITIIFIGNMGIKNTISTLKLLLLIILSIVLINTLILDRSFLVTAMMILRLLGIVIALNALVYSTSIKELGEGIEYGLQPLGRFKFPYKEVTTMITLTLRFLPEIKDEMNNILNSQICRGVDIKDSLIGKIKALLPLSINIFIITLRRSLSIAMAMDARGYSKRSIIQEKRIPVIEDFLLMGGTLIIGILIILF